MLRTSWRRSGAVGVSVFVLLLGMLARPFVVTAGGGGSAAEDSVRAAETLRAQALLQADTTALSRLVADEFYEISRLGQLRTKAENLRDIASGALRLTSVKYDSLTVRVYGDVAVLRGIANTSGTLHGFPFAGKVWYTRVFVRRDSRWQAVAMQHTPLP